MTHGRGNAVHSVCTLESLATAHNLSFIFQVTLDGFKWERTVKCSLSSLADGYIHGRKLDFVNSSGFNLCFGYLEEEEQPLVVVKRS